MAMSASTHTISNKVKPACETLVIPGACQMFRRNVRGNPAAALLAVRAIGDDVVGRVLSGSAVNIRMTPWIVRNIAALHIGSVPGLDPRRPLHQCGEPLGRRWKAAGVEIE